MGKCFELDIFFCPSVIHIVPQLFSIFTYTYVGLHCRLPFQRIVGQIRGGCQIKDIMTLSMDLISLNTYND